VAISATLQAMLDVEAPQYASDASAIEAFEYWYAQAIARLNATSYGLQYVRACMLWALHRMTVQDEIAAAVAGAEGLGSGASVGDVGTVTSRRARDLSETYANTTGSSSSNAAGNRVSADDELKTTPYGRQLLQLRATRHTSFATVLGR
jgi:hypothetical protein